MNASDVVERIDIVPYIAQFCDLEKRSDGEWWGLSPLQDENTPSFSVNEDLQRFYDFSSGTGGNVLDFVRAYHHCSLYQGIRLLMDYAGISETDEGGPTKRLLATSIAKRFRPEKQKPEKDVASKHPLPDDYMERYEWDEDKLALWREEGIGAEALSRFSVRYDPFSDRIVFPIRSVDGRIINVCGRTLDPDFKEKKLRKYTYFKSFGTLDTIYGLSENKTAILQKGEVILFEGAKSVMLAHTWGIENTGALLTSHLSKSQLDILIRLGVRVVFALDAEVDVRKDKTIRRLLPYAQVEWLHDRAGLLGPKDAPVDKGPDVFRTLYERREVLR